MNMTMEFLRISPSRKFAAVSAAAFIVVALAAGGFVQAVGTIRRDEYVRNATRQKINDLADERRRSRLSEGLLRERLEDIRRIGAFFVDRRSPIAFIEAVETAAARTENTIVLDVDESASGESALHFRLTVEGREDNLLRFARFLELLPYAIDIQDLIFQKTAADNGSGTVSGVPREDTARLLLSLDVAAR